MGLSFVMDHHANSDETIELYTATASYQKPTTNAKYLRLTGAIEQLPVNYKNTAIISLKFSE